jgi:hypothetical protein
MTKRNSHPFQAALAPRIAARATLFSARRAEAALGHSGSSAWHTMAASDFARDALAAEEPPESNHLVAQQISWVLDYVPQRAFSAGYHQYRDRHQNH